MTVVLWPNFLEPLPRWHRVNLPQAAAVGAAWTVGSNSTITNPLIMLNILT